MNAFINYKFCAKNMTLDENNNENDNGNDNENENKEKIFF